MRDPDLQWRAQLLEHRELIDRLARRILGDAELAEDVAQETWRIALERPLREPRSLAAWLRRVAANVAFKLHRERRRRRRREHLAARDGTARSAVELVAEDELRNDVLEALRELREPARTTLLLRHVDGLPPRRIAARLGVPVETVKGRIKRATAELRARLEARGHDRSQGAVLLALPFGEAGEPKRPAIRSTAPLARAAALVGALTVIAIAVVTMAGTDDPLVRTITTSRAAAVGAFDSHVLREPATARRPAAAPSTRTRVAAHLPRPSELRVRVTWSENGAPAEGVGVRAVAWGATQPLLETMRGISDAEGRVVFAAVPPGRVAVTADRGGRTVVRVAHDQVVDAELSVSPGVDVTGLVRDPHGRPLAGAAVWLSEPRDHTEGSFRAVTDAHGSFALRSISPLCWIGARAPAYAPTRLRVVGGPAGERIDVALRLSAAGGSVAGTVLDPAGRPVVGASVLIGLPDEFVMQRPVDGPPTIDATGVMIVTDVDGRFAADGFAPGEQCVLVRSPRFAPFAGSVSVVARRCARTTITLAEGAVVTGVFRDASQRPVAGARVGIGDDLAFLAFAHSRATFFGAFTHTAADGSFHLPGVPSGPAVVWAKTRGGERSEAMLDLLPGGTTRWQPVLGGPAVIGRVVDETGAPLVGWFVEAHVGAGTCNAELPRTDADGRFVIARSTHDVARVDVREPGTMRVCGSAMSVPSRELAIRVPRALWPSAFVIGTVEDGAGCALPDATVLVHRPDEGPVPPSHVDETGGFRVGPLPPGDYTVVVESAGRGSRSVAAGALSRNESRRIGVIELTPE